MNRRAILSAVQQHGLSSQGFRCLEPTEEALLVQQIEARLVSSDDRIRWWESFCVPTLTRCFPDGSGFRRLEEISPDHHEPIWFIVEECSSAGLAAFETTVRSASMIIGECHAFEYYLVAQDYSWLICENHHDVVIAMGAAMPRLAALTA
ncbi:MAG: hypothetical protein KDA51_14650 [Planctomycetales bacterium]|nr:hypothetical protein [Planctomycetales bacterium]MCB1589574.1 hypothetical protein [Xanthomonadales bacterium]